MSLSEAIGVLKRNKSAMELVISLGNGTDEMERLIKAYDVIIDWVDKMYSALMKIGKIG